MTMRKATSKKYNLKKRGKTHKNKNLKKRTKKRVLKRKARSRTRRRRKTKKGGFNWRNKNVTKPPKLPPKSGTLSSHRNEPLVYPRDDDMTAKAYDLEARRPLPPLPEPPSIVVDGSNNDLTNEGGLYATLQPKKKGRLKRMVSKLRKLQMPDIEWPI